MKPEIATVRKIRWYHWHDNMLFIQVFTRGVVKQSDTKGLVPHGSIQYAFTGIDSKEKVDQIVEDVRNGTIA